MVKPAPRSYPRSVDLNDTPVVLRLMGPADRDRILKLARSLPRHDLLFMRRDITRPEVVDRWLREIEEGSVTTLLAEVGTGGGALKGYATLHRSDLDWSSHVAELRVLVAEEMRGRGLGRLLTQEVFALALASGIEKMVARMTTDQKGAIATFEGLGFRPEGLLRDHVKDTHGTSHDLVVMSHAVAEFHQTMAAYGVTDSLG